MSRVQEIGQGGAGAMEPAADPKRLRWRLVDFWRGVALVIMCIDHLPAHPLQRFTPAMLGFSDVAAWFVLLSGFATAESYSWRLGQASTGRVWLHACKRALVLYGGTLVLVVGAFLLLRGGPFWDAPLVGPWLYPGLAGFEVEPLRWVGDTLSLGQIPRFAHVLVLFIVLLVLSVPMLTLERRCRHSSLLVSAAIYGITQGVWSLETWHDGFFHPLSWQVLFVAGMWLSQNRELWMRRSAANIWVLGLAVATLLLCLLVRRSYRFEESAPWLSWLWPQADKGLLQWGYLAHACLVIFVLGSLMTEDRCRRLPYVGWICVIGAYPLLSFVIGTLLSYVAIVLFSPWMDWWLGCAVVAGIQATLWMATLLWRRLRSAPR